MKKQNTKKRRKILLSLLVIAFVGIVLTASTYTWFTANTTVTVEQMDVNVAASNGLQVSVDAINWKTLITADDIKGAGTTYATAVNQIPTQPSEPVSTIGEIDPATGFMKMFKGVIESNDAGNYILTATQEKEAHGKADGKFIAFDLFFQVNQDTPLYLTSNSSVKALNTSSGIENAGRVAFIEQGNSPAGTAAATVQALKAADNTGLKLWEPNYDVHTAAAVKNASDNYGITTTQTGGTLLPYHGVKADITKTADIALNSTKEEFFAPVTPTNTSPAAGIPSDAYSSLMTLKAGITKMRIYMWVEGQDVDCENNASGGSLAFNLQFSSLEKA